MENVLTYDRAGTPQQYAWDCGPASCQVALSARGIVASEDQLIREIGTTVNGTDYVGLIERVLDKRVPDARYTSVYVDNDPPTFAQRQALWDNLTRSIDAGFGVVANWVSPPSNRPIGIKGSQTPAYHGTIYHYVAAMGYDASVRAVWIADPGFSPFGYWVSFDNFATLIPPKGYAFADVTVTPTAAPVDPVADVLAKAMGGQVPFDRYRALAPAVSACLRQCDATTVDRIAMWCAQIGHESGGLRWMEEIADGSAYEGRADLGNTQAGDGCLFKGRGPIQITGRSNYQQLSAWAYRQGLVPSVSFFADDPGQLSSDRYGFLGVAWYWTVARPTINAMCDRGDLDGVTRAINGGLNGIADRRDRYNRARALGEQLLTLTTTTTGDDMAAVPQDQWDRVYRELTQRLTSRSIYRTPGEGPIDTAAGMVLNVDAMQHAELVERLARLGDRDALARVARTASGRGAVTDPQAIAQAATVLADIERTTPTILADFLKG